ncbi:hypothetical protein CALCODRAFT_499074 [Calocera cornea HHB12733]|uniref:N-acetyltransferase domain-containing protein n=1 Tax=Calocera cornea HHB12733 TaxID=1353952 RepID=A0A165ELR6_9BASI|nr:hypothetical protein CALCODRAFT_499074 [Calocera cornea HHB12733]
MRPSPLKGVCIHVRRLVAPSDEEFSGVLRVMRIAFAKDPILQLVLAGDLTAARVDGLHACYIRSGLIEGNGEVWVAEAERSDTPGKREIVGQAMWLAPGGQFIADERGQEAVGWAAYAPVMGDKQERWFLDYYLTRFAEMWARCLPSPGEQWSSTYRLSKLSVLPEHQDLGVASLLVRPVLERGLRAGIRILGQATNERSLRVYERVGARVLDTADFWPLLPGGGQPAEDGPGAVRIWAVELNPGELERHAHWTRAPTNGSAVAKPRELVNVVSLD